MNKFQEKKMEKLMTFLFENSKFTKSPLQTPLLKYLRDKGTMTEVENLSEVL